MCRTWFVMYFSLQLFAACFCIFVLWTIAVRRKAMEEALKVLNIWTNVLGRKSNDMWNILLETGEAPKTFSRGILTSKTLRFQTEHMGTQKNTDYFTWGAYVYHWQPFGAYFSSYRLLKWVYSIKSKSGITTSDVEVLETLIRPKFNEVPNIITCCGRNTFVVVECCWACAAVGYLVKLCPTRNPVPISQPTPDQSRVEAEKRASSGPVEWTEELRRGAKTQLRHHSVAGKTATAAI